MNVSDAFRYQNVLSQWMSEAEKYMTNEQNMTRKTVERRRSSVLAGALDETTEETQERPVNVPNNIVIQFYLDIVDEKIMLAVAIENAKKDSKDAGHIDATIQANRLRRRSIATLRTLSMMRDHYNDGIETEYYIGADGEPKDYLYPTVIHYEVDFDRENVRSRIKQLLHVAEQASLGIEKELRSRRVSFKPKFDQTDTFYEALETYYLSFLPQSVEA